MSAAVVFAGPTLPAADVREDGFALLPPARKGDLLRALALRPRAIGLIDGYFETTASVWHKEVLWVLSRGVAVFGAASMGALRAAELHRYGMVGVGRIFALYRDGRLTRDDEVAVVHGPQELGFRPLTEALVNVRATLDKAAADGVLAPAEARRLLDIAQRLHFKERSWDRVLARAAADGPAAGGLQAFRAWLPEGAVDLKRDDARAMIEEMQRFLEVPPAPAPCPPVPQTSYLAALLRDCGLPGEPSL